MLATSITGKEEEKYDGDMTFTSELKNIQKKEVEKGGAKGEKKLRREG